MNAGTGETPPLIRELRRRRRLGRTTIRRGERPKAPDIRFKNVGCLGIVAALVGLQLAIWLIAATVHALFFVVDLAGVCCLLLIAEQFRAWAIPAVFGKPFDAHAFAGATPRLMFLFGAVPAAAATYGATHGLLPVLVATAAGGFGFPPLVRALDGKRVPPLSDVLPRKNVTPVAHDPEEDAPGPFGLWIGEATGALSAMGHAAGIVAGADVTLDLQDAAKNIAVFGETGTGKTTRVLTHLLVQALDLDCGALIFDVRGDFHETVSRAAKLTGKPVARVGVGGDGVLGLNLLAGLTADTAAGFLEAAFRLLGQGQGDSGFWVSLAVTRCRHALALLQHVPDGYTLKGLHRYVFEDTYRAQALTTAQEALAELQLRANDGEGREADLAARRLKASLDYELTVAPNYADKERSGLNRTIETALARFTDPELEDAFCAPGAAQADIADVLDGRVLVVNVPRERFKAAAAVVYLFVKERFFQALNARPSMEDGARKRRPVIFFCDEYQQLCSPGDANFFDTSRALGVVGIVASQSIEAYINALGDEHAAGALLANFANVIAFRSTERTMRYVAGKLGEVEVWRESYNAGKTDLGWFNATTNQGRSAALQRQTLLDPQIFRMLGPDKAVALLTVRGAAFDDVVMVPQVTGDDLA